MAITKEQAIDILDKFDFFQGQRAGRELWNDKPFEVQEQDIKSFSNDVSLLKDFVADVVPKSEVEAMQRLYGEKLEVAEALIATLNKTKSEVAREIFEEIDKGIISCRVDEYSKEYGYVVRQNYNANAIIRGIAELKKKYTEGEQRND